MKKILPAFLSALMLPFSLQATERHFGFSYESNVLPEGARELETYTTYSFGRDAFYSALEERLEFELGLGGDVQTSLYLNFKQGTEDQGPPAGIVNEFAFDGISSEWKVKLMDNVADPVGMGLYAELKFAPDAFETELKLILDKKVGNLLWTLNLTAEPEFSYFPNSPTAWELVPSMGAGVFLSDNFLLGIEGVNINVYEGDPSANTQATISVGPVVAYAAKDWWVNLAVLPQVADLNGAGLDLTESQRWQVRLSTAWSL